MGGRSKLFSELGGAPLNTYQHDNQTLDIRELENQQKVLDETLAETIGNVNELQQTAGQSMYILGNYASGMVIENDRQYVRYDNLLYYWTGPVPFTTTGNFYEESYWTGGVQSGIEWSYEVQEDGEFEFNIPYSFTSVRLFVGGVRLTRVEDYTIDVINRKITLTKVKLSKGVLVTAELNSRDALSVTQDRIDSLTREISEKVGFVNYKLTDLSEGQSLTLTTRVQTVSFSVNGEYYKWDGVLPKVVNYGDPEPAQSEQGTGKWIPVGSGALKSELMTAGETTGAAIVYLRYGGTVADGIRYITPEMARAKGDGTTDDTAALRSAVTLAKTYGLKLMGMGTYKIANQSVDISGVVIENLTIVGTGASSQLLVNGDTDITKLNLSKCGIRHINGIFKLDQFEINDCSATAALLCQQLAANSQLFVTNGIMRRCNYGYLRQGSPASSKPLTATLLQNLQFFDMKSDPIEINLAVADTNTRIDNITVDNVDATSTGNANWGIAIGLAGTGNYSLTAPDSEYMSDVVISNVKVKGAKQCIHMEKCRNITIRDIEIYPDVNKSTGVGLDTGGLIAYGCKDIDIDGVIGSPANGTEEMIRFLWGTVSNAYTFAHRNIRIRNVNITGTVHVEVCTTDTLNSTVEMKNIKATTISLQGMASEYRLSDWSAEKIILDFRYTSGDARDNYRRNKWMVANISNMKCLDPNTGAANVTVQNITVDTLEVSDCNFPIQKTTTATHYRGTPAWRQNGIIYHAKTGTPYGMALLAGDTIVDKDGTMFTVTAAGALFYANETVAAATSGSNSIRSKANTNWTGQYYKTAGCKVKIAGGGGADGADYVGTIVRSGYVNGGNYYFDVYPALQSNVPDGAVLTSVDTPAFKTV